MMTCLLVFLSLTPCLITGCWAETSPYAVKCPNSLRNFASESLPTPPVTMDLFIFHSFCHPFYIFKTIFSFYPSTGNCFQCSSAFSVLKKRVWPLSFILLNMLFHLYDVVSLMIIVFSRETAVTAVSVFVPAVARIKCSDPVWEPQVWEEHVDLVKNVLLKMVLHNVLFLSLIL